MKRIIFFILMIASAITVFGQDGSSIDNSKAFCTGITYTYWALSGVGTAQTGPDYDCLNTQPDPTWLHLRVLTDGDIDIDITAGHDVDFALWGPASSLSAIRTYVKGGNAPIDCSYSTSNTEQANIVDGTTGEYYLLVVTNYYSDEQEITITQGSGSGTVGTSDCTILPPDVSTTGSSSVTGVSASCSGNVTNDYSQTVTQRGIAYNTTGNPTTSGTHQAASSGGLGTFTVGLAGLTPGTTYYYRAYATSSNGTTYGQTLSFDTPPNQPPVANNDSCVVYVNDWRSIPGKPTGGVLINDTDGDGDPLTVGNPGNRTSTLGVTVDLASDGSFTYTAPTNSVDVTDSFNYYATDGQANSNTATVFINLRKAIYNGTAPNGTVGNWNGGYFPNSVTDAIFQTGNIEVSTSMVIRNLQIYDAASFFCTGGATLTVNNSIGNENRTGMTLSSPVIFNSGIKVHD